MNYLQIPLVILATLSTSLALADDFKTNSGKEYKNATVTRAEPDGIVIKFAGGMERFPSLNYPKKFRNDFTTRLKRQLPHRPPKWPAFNRQINK
jgi:hypothetical protein